jgi:enoyl-CoA hydratase/carnithine racemase
MMLHMLCSAPQILEVQRKGPIAALTLNRPSRCNALDEELNRALLQACNELRDDKQIKVVVLRGNGRHFCGGSDLNDLYKADREVAARVIGLEVDVCYALSSLPQCTVAVLHGKCFGGGAALPLYCDLRLGYMGVEFAMPEVPLGWVPPWGLNRMLANLPRPFALEMLLSGRSCSTEEALRNGWIQRVLEEGDDGHAFIASLAALPACAREDTLRLTAPRDADAILADDRNAFAAFLDHFDSDHARATVSHFIEVRNTKKNVSNQQV